MWSGDSFTSTVRRNPLPLAPCRQDLDLRVPFHGSPQLGTASSSDATIVPSGVVNGDVLTVSRINSDLTINTWEGPILPADFCDFCHGYVVTSHKAQGRTHQSVNSLAAAEVDVKAAYVACSRGRQPLRVYTPDLEHFLRGLPCSGDRTAALDLAAQPNQASPSIPAAAVSELVELGQGEGTHVSVPTPGRSLLTTKGPPNRCSPTAHFLVSIRVWSFERRPPMNSVNSGFFK